MATSKTSSPRAAASRPGSRSDAIALLSKDHKEVRQLFRAFDKLRKGEAEGPEKQEIAEQICDMLTVHATVEEELFYPMLRQALDQQDLLDEAEVEHASVKELVAQIQGMQADDPLYDAKVTVLGEYVNHHVEEEEGELFPKAVKAGLDLVELGAQLKARKEELMGATAEDEAA